MYLLISASIAADCDTVYDNDVAWNGLLHDSFSSDDRSPFGAVSLSETVTLSLRACADDLDAVRIRVWDAAAQVESWQELSLVASQTDPEVGPVDRWEVSITVPDSPNVLYYFFEATSGSDTDYYVDDEPIFFGGGPGEVSDDYDDTRGFQISVYDPEMVVPQWFSEALVYQIFPDRFRDGDATSNHTDGDGPYYGQYTTRSLDWSEPLSGDCLGDDQTRAECFYGGDLTGIAEQMDVIAELGVTALYLNPIFAAPTNHRYDTTDFLAIDDDLGGGAAFTELLSSADAAGISLILDGVFNHVSAESPWFDLYGAHAAVGACESADSEYRSWFFLPDIGAPARTEDGETVTCDGQTYEAWGTYFHIPKLDASQQAVRDVFYDQGTVSVAGHWLDAGARGWRLDVGSQIDGGAAEDPDNDYWESFRQAVRGVDEEAVIIGEEWNDASGLLLGREYDTVMNYRFRSAVLDWLFDGCSGDGCTDGTMFADNDSQEWRESGAIDALSTEGLVARLTSIEEDYPPMVHAALLNLLGSHDTSRIGWLLTKISSEDADIGADKLRLASLLQYTWPGVPSLYYADEVGIATASGWNGSEWQDDPYSRSTYPWADLGMSPDTVLQDWFIALGAARSALAPLRSGAHEVLLADDDARLLILRRYTETESAVIVLNRSPSAQTVTVDASAFWADTTLTEHLTGDKLAITGGQLTLSVEGLSGALLSAADNAEPGDTGSDTGGGGPDDTDSPDDTDAPSSSDTGSDTVTAPVEGCGCSGGGAGGVWAIFVGLAALLTRSRRAPGLRR